MQTRHECETRKNRRSFHNAQNQCKTLIDVIQSLYYIQPSYNSQYILRYNTEKQTSVTLLESTGRMTEVTLRNRTQTDPTYTIRKMTIDNTMSANDGICMKHD